jgi:hypothetical protein
MQKRAVSLLIQFFLYQGLTFAQVSKANLHSECIPSWDTLDGQKVHPLANKMPNYPGGDSKMLQFITDNIKSPEMKKNGRVKGTVSVTFVIDSLGRVRNVCLLRQQPSDKPDPIDQEVLRLFGMMPRWEPGILNGKKTYVRIKMPMSILFK